MGDKMNQNWQQFLLQHGATLQDGAVQHFGDFTAELVATSDHTVLCDLSQFGTLKVAGEESQKFLQNLLSSDINTIKATTAHLSSINSPKGRMLASFLIWQQEGNYLLQLPQSLVAAMQKKLSMYVLRSKVKVSDASEELVCLGLAGKDAASLLTQQFGAMPEIDWAVTQHDNASIIRLSSQRYQINVSIAQATSIWTSLASKAKPVGSGCWDWLSIRAGIPVITPATQEQFVLQMTNLDLLGGVSFTKGCYPGQEIVARTHYLGKQKRRMFLAHVAAGQAPAAGNEVFNAGTPDQPCGMVMNASPAPDGGYDLLAVMQLSSYEAKQVHLHSATGAELTFLPLPYAFPVTE